jgi:hypothetical protein
MQQPTTLGRARYRGWREAVAKRWHGMDYATTDTEKNI